MKLVHAADLHLDSPLRGLDRYEEAPASAIRGASRRALERLVDLCLAEKAELLLIAGDVYDGAWKDYNTGLFFRSQLARLRAASVPVALVSGNHDAQSAITRHLDLPDNAVLFSSRRPETRVFERIGVAVHGQSFATRAVTDDLAARYPEREDGLFNIGLLHTCAMGREGHDSYAPTSLEVLRSKGYDYWALGHIHRREVLSDAPWIVFPGNLQGRRARESGSKGATILDVEEGCVRSVDHVALDTVRFVACAVDATLAASGHDVVDLVRAQLARAVEEGEGRILAARVVLTGRSRAHAALAADPQRWTAAIRAAAIDAGGDELWIEAIRSGTEATIDLDALRSRDDAVGQLARSLGGLRDDEAELRRLLAVFDDVKKHLPAELREGEDAIDLDDPRLMRELLDDVEPMLLARLAEGEREG